MAYPPSLATTATAGATTATSCPTCGQAVASIDAKKQSDLTVALKAHWDRRQQAWDAVAAAPTKTLAPSAASTLQSDLATLTSAVKAIAPNVDPLAL